MSSAQPARSRHVCSGSDVLSAFIINEVGAIDDNLFHHIIRWQKAFTYTVIVHKIGSSLYTSPDFIHLWLQDFFAGTTWVIAAVALNDMGKMARYRSSIMKITWCIILGVTFMLLILMQLSGEIRKSRHVHGSLIESSTENLTADDINLVVIR